MPPMSLGLGRGLLHPLPNSKESDPGWRGGIVEEGGRGSNYLPKPPPLFFVFLHFLHFHFLNFFFELFF